MNDPVIEFNNVSKHYSYWENRPYSFKKLLSQVVRGNFDFGSERRLEVINNVSFKIYPREFVGIMGRNGAGKSTLLKMIAGIHKPNSGNIKVNGVCAPMLELGAGFADELSGLENIYLNAAVLGFGRQRTQQHLQSIIDFSELGDKIHMPVRNYSSGMTVRLGFAIACHLEAPILLFDEILAVGDIGFQRKSLGRIMDLFNAGRSIVLVSHNPDAIRHFCSRCILIDQQKIIFDGPADEGANKYIEMFGRGESGI